tara:strand:+ start:33664 stop:34914 length:1251 start_codon:yes stop_codon:yes gene_type:complete
MSLKKFNNSDVFINTMRTSPSGEFIIFDSKVIYNSIPEQSGTRNGQVRNVSTELGNISLYELNIDRPDVSTGRYIGTSSIPDTGRIYSWISKDSAGASFKTVSQVNYDNEFQYGDILTNDYPLSASITREYITSSFLSTASADYNAHYVALRNTLNYYSARSEHYAVTSAFGNKDSQTLNLISVPSIFYGSRIKPGSVSLKWYFTGSLIGELQDPKQNGELVQVGPEGSVGSGSVAGVALYEEGILLLTGSWAITSDICGIREGATPLLQNDNPRWLYFGAGANDGVSQSTANTSFVSASFEMSLKGQTDTQVITMMAHAKKGEVNYSNNPTFLEYGQTKTFYTSSHVYEEGSDVKLKNFVSSSHSDYSASFERQVFISRVAIYDKNKNLIGIATLANPVLKKEAEALTFKLSIDL